MPRDEAKADAKSEGKDDDDAGAKGAKGGPTPTVNVTKIEVEPNDCALEDPLDLSIEFILDGEIMDAWWEIKARLARRLRMRPALLVDLDCDLYTSSVQALRFVLDTGVLAPGGYVYLDDIMPWTWREKGKPALEQKLALEELTSEYGLRWEEVPLNATRRDYVYERPVLMLAACVKCPMGPPAAGAAAAASRGAEGDGGGGSCITPAAGYGST